MFKQLLENLLDNVDGAVVGLVGGLDGLLVDHVSRQDGYSHEQMAADCTQLLKSAMQTAASLPAGSLQELSLSTRELRLVLRLLSESYFVALLLSESANLGRARFELRKMHFDLEKELAL